LPKSSPIILSALLNVDSKLLEILCLEMQRLQLCDNFKYVYDYQNLPFRGNIRTSKYFHLMNYYIHNALSLTDIEHKNLQIDAKTLINSMSNIINKIKALD